MLLPWKTTQTIVYTLNPIEQYITVSWYIIETMTDLYTLLSVKPTIKSSFGYKYTVLFVLIVERQVTK